MTGSTSAKPSQPATDAPSGLFRARQLLEMDACTRCGECLRACDSFRVAEDEGVSLMGMIRRRRRLFRAENSWLGKLFRRQGASEQAWEEFQQGLFSCTLCGRCEQYCPVSIRTKDLALTMRQDLATARCMMPKNLGVARDAILEEGNVFGYPNEERALWTEFMDDLPDDLLSKERADVLYFVGCVSSFSPAVQELPQAFLGVLLDADVDVGILAGREWCCGFPLIVGGLAKDAERLLRHNIEEGIQRFGAKTVVFNCPSCYYTWTKYYRCDLPPGVELYHSTQFLAKLLAERNVEVQLASKVVTYHDPCDLGRGSGVYEEPRAILCSLPGAELREAPNNRAQGHCCGGGGDLEMVDPDLAAAICINALEGLEGTGAETLAVACPQCKRMFQNALKKVGSGMEVLDIVELVREAMQRVASTGLAARR